MSEIGVLSAWARAGALPGKSSEAPDPPVYRTGWQAGTPDLEASPQSSFEVPADGPDFYRNFPLATDEPSDRWIGAFEVIPGRPSVVHHVILYLDLKGQSKALDEQDPGPGYTTKGGIGFRADAFLSAWMAGMEPVRMPEGVGMRLPQGATIVMQVHYHPNGKPERDRTAMGLHFLDRMPKRKLRFAAVLSPWIRIPAGDAKYRAGSVLPVLRDATLYSVTPHMHLLGKRMGVSAVVPGGERKKLVYVPRWDFRWQPMYTYREPVRLKKGTRIVMDALFDNSASNPVNPHRPPREVRWGDDSDAEMCMAFLAFTSDDENLFEGREAPGAMPEFGVKPPAIRAIERPPAGSP